MHNVISAAKKKSFLVWFMDHFQLKKREASWLLSYLSSDEELLNRVHFVEKFRNLPRILILSANCVSMPPLKFYKGNVIISNVEEIFRDIRNNKDKDLYIGLFFKDRHACPLYLSVLEHHPAERIAQANQHLQELIIDIMLEDWVRQHQMRQLRQSIDQALDRKDEADFSRLTEQLLRMQNSIEEG